MSTPEMLTAAGIAVTVIGALFVAGWRLAARLATLTTKQDMTSTLLKEMGDRIDRRFDELGTKVQAIAVDVGGLVAVDGYVRKKAQ
jgi:hypothetical protein